MSPPYGAYGARARDGLARSAYAGEVEEHHTQWYLLGPRPYAPLLRRFLSADAASPFQAGGFNRYAYCGGDPVNRIDPSGNAWMPWQRLNMNSLSGGAADTGPIVSMPATATMTAAAVVDTAALGTPVVAAGSRSPASSQGSAVFGRVASGGEGIGVALPGARKGLESVDRFVEPRAPGVQRGRAPSTPGRKVNVMKDPSRLEVNRAGELSVRPEWVERSHPRNAESRICAADSVITADHFKSLFATLSRQGVTKVNLYTGSHGEVYGRNWHLRTGERLDTEGSFFLDDLVSARRVGKNENIDVKPVSMMEGMTEADMRQRLSRSGVHVMGFCYGVADSAVMAALEVGDVTVYKMRKRWKAAWLQAQGKP